MARHGQSSGERRNNELFAYDPFFAQRTKKAARSKEICFQEQHQGIGHVLFWHLFKGTKLISYDFVWFNGAHSVRYIGPNAIRTCERTVHGVSLSIKQSDLQNTTLVRTLSYSSKFTMRLAITLSILGFLSANTLILAAPIPNASVLRPRLAMAGEGASLFLSTFNAVGCPAGQSTTFDVAYSKQVVANTKSYSLSRALTDGEQLDWSTYTPNQGDINGTPAACTSFEEVGSPDNHGHNLLANTCYPLVATGSAAVSLFSPLKLAFMAHTDWFFV